MEGHIFNLLFFIKSLNFFLEIRKKKVFLGLAIYSQNKMGLLCIYTYHIFLYYLPIYFSLKF